MKGAAIISALAALNAVSAEPTKSEAQPPTKRADSKTPKVSVSGNGMSIPAFN
jgi:hypothetical protein